MSVCVVVRLYVRCLFDPVGVGPFVSLSFHWLILCWFTSLSVCLLFLLVFLSFPLRPFPSSPVSLFLSLPVRPLCLFLSSFFYYWLPLFLKLPMCIYKKVQQTAIFLYCKCVFTRKQIWSPFYCYWLPLFSILSMCIYKEKFKSFLVVLAAIVLILSMCIYKKKIMSFLLLLAANVFNTVNVYLQEKVQCFCCCRLLLFYFKCVITRKRSWSPFSAIGCHCFTLNVYLQEREVELLFTVIGCHYEYLQERQRPDSSPFDNISLKRKRKSFFTLCANILIFVILCPWRYFYKSINSFPQTVRRPGP